MKIKIKDLQYDKDFALERAKEMDLFKLKLELPEGLQITGYTFDGEVLIRRRTHKI